MPIGTSLGHQSRDMQLDTAGLDTALLPPPRGPGQEQLPSPGLEQRPATRTTHGCRGSQPRAFWSLKTQPGAATPDGAVQGAVSLESGQAPPCEGPEARDLDVDTVGCA